VQQIYRVRDGKSSLVLEGSWIILRAGRKTPERLHRESIDGGKYEDILMLLNHGNIDREFDAWLSLTADQQRYLRVSTINTARIPKYSPY